jgi:hypothetical protein
MVVQAFLVLLRLARIDYLSADAAIYQPSYRFAPNGAAVHWIAGTETNIVSATTHNNQQDTLTNQD